MANATYSLGISGAIEVILKTLKNTPSTVGPMKVKAAAIMNRAWIEACFLNPIARP